MQRQDNNHGELKQPILNDGNRLSDLPHRSAVEMDHEPFGRIESNAIRILNSSQICLVFGANESGAGICGVNVKPHLLGFACEKKRLPLVQYDITFKS